jgi:FlaA1/EpsC-like NDP-sugar epimerase
MPDTAIIIGTKATCQRVEQQLALLDERPIVLGWVLVDAETGASSDGCVLGNTDVLEAIVAQRTPGMAIVSLPGVMRDLIATLRTRLRQLRIADRFMPTLEDQLAGVGPRTNLEIDPDRLLDRPARVMDEQAISDIVGGRCVLVTGAGGSIGSEIARIVAQFAPAQLLLMDRSENALFEIDRQIARRLPALPRKAILHDVVDAHGTQRIMQQYEPHLIFHAAAHKHVPMMEDHPAAAVENNLFGTKAVADAAHAVGAERCVLVSTDKAVNPTSIMGATKRLAELYIQQKNQQSDTGYSVVRFGNVLGSSGSVLDVWARQIADGGPMTVTDPAMTRYFMTIPEAASLVIQSAALLDDTQSAGEVFLLDMGDPIRIVDLARRFATMHGLKPILPDEPGEAVGSSAIRIVYTGIRPGEKLHEQLAFDVEAMRPTRHPDINIWCLEAPDRRYVERMIGTLASCGRLRPEQVTRLVWDILHQDVQRRDRCPQDMVGVQPT